MASISRSDDHALAAELATAAGEVLLGIRARVGHADGKALKNAGDQGSHEFLMAALAERCPGDAVLSEEGKDDAARLRAERVWIVDPLDGTREFSEEGRTDWAVHVALWERGRLVAGAVALPAQGRTLHTTAADGGVRAVVGGAAGRQPLTVPAPQPDLLRIAVSRTRPPQFVQSLAERLETKVELVPIGSAGAKISAVLLGDVDAYVHAGGQYEWDNAAPVAVAKAAGAHATRIDGSEPTYNRPDPMLPDILVCHPASAPMLLAGIRDVKQEPQG
ncbi:MULTISPECIES: 3'(2'),5'-bisphosphate nucleotidase CysQ [Thermomonospora]|uniref:inositol-phosphate phosphatase n=1 Tax=Thermomonospora curvata (strain ATCC 19995 / DSM 43183 / JCM 3096 / KCTC 9072 / NBRC 15933 / NCIMB 10081 / Henssen B9) TaxID=471852 RepID=D1A7J9_THECD|nr:MULTISPECIES: 3'(2'),5'-bisphosphate nucleotidase CysQ [Thermomonospora]ACY96588.1 inositol monophosphatase [Thermomonospora curvata DSM 43183]PKK15396.1 MAG: 3'(2'),5'-bisphosphate nucleotidase CysQ [Thermomonospora sp. CIF 1]